MTNIIQINKSTLRRKLLVLYFTNADSNYYVREIAVILNEDPSNLSKELNRLANEGIFLSELRGNQKYYSLNKDYPLYQELESIVSKTVGVQGLIKKELEQIVGIKFAFIYGSFAHNGQNGVSDIDLAVIGDINENKLLEKISQLQKNLNREINYTLYSASEWEKTKKDSGTFTANIYDEPKIVLIGREDEL